MNTVNKYARKSLVGLSKTFKESRYGSKLHHSLLRAGMMKDRCRASGKMSDMY